MIPEPERDPRRTDRSEVELPLGPDVEELHAERSGSREAGEEDRSRGDERGRERPVAGEAGLDDLAVRRARGVPAHREDDGHDRERDQQRSDGNEDREPPRLLEPALEADHEPRPPAMSSPISSIDAAPAWSSPDDLALVHDEDAIREGADLVEVLAQQQDRHALGRGLPKVRVHRLDRADVEAARRLRDDEDERIV